MTTRCAGAAARGRLQFSGTISLAFWINGPIPAMLRVLGGPVCLEPLISRGIGHRVRKGTTCLRQALTGRCSASGKRPLHRAVAAYVGHVRLNRLLVMRGAKRRSNPLALLLSDCFASARNDGYIPPRPFYIIHHIACRQSERLRALARNPTPGPFEGRRRRSSAGG